MLDKESLHVLLLLTEILDRHCICTKKAKKIYNESIHYIAEVVKQYLQHYTSNKEDILKWLKENCDFKHNAKIEELSEQLLQEVVKWWEQNAEEIVYKCKEYDIEQRKKRKQEETT